MRIFTTVLLSTVLFFDFCRSDQLKARKVLETEKAKTLHDFEADRERVKVRNSGMGAENIQTKPINIPIARNNNQLALIKKKSS